ncbi:DotU family type IV/VI secretion system protein [Piscirickettsia litoralis]|uniref:DotU family type IV/VI secretion system protein n=1 Tax=Piscirickettsia litoralis TaxID=1891921 RepID=UPI0013011EE4|nr:DotU family type IV/VI secretion system protein [Piscirickettsia litoralis]
MVILKRLIIFLGKTYGGDVAYLIAFALTVYLDEYVNLKVGYKEGEAWELVQREMFDLDTGGNYFYKALNHIVSNKYYPKIVYQVYYFILKDGFMGEMVNHNSNVARDYLIQLENKCEGNLADTNKTLLNFNTEGNIETKKSSILKILSNYKAVFICAFFLYLISTMIVYFN